MPDVLKERLGALREIAPRLNAISDEATKIIESVETLLVQELNLGIAGEAVFDETFEEERDDDAEEVRKFVTFLSLNFDRVHGHFHIHVLKEVMRRDEDDELISISKERTGWESCSRGLKLQAFKVLPNLLENITKRANEMSAKAEESASRMREMLGVSAD